jgi:hypothetical protein
LTDEDVICRGYGDIILSKDELPSVAQNLKHVSVSDVNYNRVGRMVLNMDGYTGQLFLGVHSPVTGCQYELWMLSTGENNYHSTNKSILAVARTLRELNILSNHSTDELHSNMTRLMEQARSISDSEVSVGTHSILEDIDPSLYETLRSIKIKKEANDQQYVVDHMTDVTGEVINVHDSTSSMRIEEDVSKMSVTSEKELEKEEEREVMARFVEKIGRREIRNDLRANQIIRQLRMAATPSRPIKTSDDGNDSYINRDMFEKPQFMSQEDFISNYIKPCTPPSEMIDKNAHLKQESLSVVIEGGKLEQSSLDHQTNAIPVDDPPDSSDDGEIPSFKYDYFSAQPSSKSFYHQFYDSFRSDTIRSFSSMKSLSSSKIPVEPSSNDVSIEPAEVFLMNSSTLPKLDGRKGHSYQSELKAKLSSSTSSLLDNDKSTHQNPDQQEQKLKLPLIRTVSQKLSRKESEIIFLNQMKTPKKVSYQLHKNLHV